MIRNLQDFKDSSRRGMLRPSFQEHGLWIEHLALGYGHNSQAMAAESEISNLKLNTWSFNRGHDRGCNRGHVHGRVDKFPTG
jgi:hypothetical protein